MDHHQHSGRLFFDPSACPANTLFLGSDDSSVFQGQTTLLSMEDTSNKRPFFTTSADFYDEEYYDEQLPEKKRRLTAEQVNLLEKSFEAENKLEPERKTELAKKLGLQPRQVAVWFQNRRARCKTKQLERDYDLLKASYDSLRSNYDSLVKDNESLKSEVVSLTEKLQGKEVSLEAKENPDTNLLGIISEVNLKAEDRVSTGSAGSAVVDHEDSRQVVDSGDSYFPDNPAALSCNCIAPGEGLQSEEEDRSDDGSGYFTNVLFSDQPAEEEGGALGWWVWS